ncbi:hypothetical protein D5R61_04820 [Lactiplantibacillus plantarum]
MGNVHENPELLEK